MGRKIQRNPKSVALAQAILEQYQPETTYNIKVLVVDNADNQIPLTISVETDSQYFYIIRNGVQLVKEGGYTWEDGYNVTKGDGFGTISRWWYMGWIRYSFQVRK